MSTKSEMLNLLSKSKGDYISGQKLAETLSISRSAIWKNVEILRNDGYTIQSKSSIGYKLVGDTDILSTDAIGEKLKYKCDIQIYDSLPSTNLTAKKLQVGSTPLLVLAGKQTAGRGRLGRSFYSPENSGLYMTLAFKPTFDLSKSLWVTSAAAVSVCKAIEKIAHVRPRIKWVNDIFLDGKKVCGILTEAETNFENGKIDKIIIGIGINCFKTDFPLELQDIAGTLAMEKTYFERNVLAAEIVNQLLAILTNFDKSNFLAEYKSRCFILGKKIIVHSNLKKEGIMARAIDIDNNCGLVVEYLEGHMKHQMDVLTTGEISIKIES